MRVKQNARKSTGGRTPSQSHQELILKNLRRYLDSDSDVDMDSDDQSMTLEMTVEGQNNGKSTDNSQSPQLEIEPIAAIKMTFGGTDNKIISPAVSQNKTTSFQQMPIKVAADVLEETPQATQHQVTMGELETPPTNDVTHPVKLPSEIESSSTDVIVIDDPMSPSPPEKRVSSRLSKSNVSVHNKHKVLEIRRKSLKNSSTNKSREKKTYTVRTRANQVKACKEFIKKYDNDILLDTLLTDSDISARKLLQGYKKKRNKSKWNKEEIREEASRVLNIEFSNETNKEARQMSPLQKCLVEFSNFVGDQFIDTILETFGGQLNAAKVLEVLKSEELESAILHKFTAVELLDLLHKSEISNVSQEILKTIPVDQIVNHIQSRTDLNTSESLLNVLLENFSQIVPNENLENNVVVNSDSKNIMINRVVNLVKSKEDLKTSEQLLNIMLQHGPTLVSDETKNNIRNFLVRKFSAAELNDMTHEIISFHLAQTK